MEEYVSIKELSNILGMDRSGTRKYILQLGYKPQKRRTRDSANQLALTLTSAEAAYVIQQRNESGFLGSGQATESECGVFYIIQLHPNLDAKWIKMGFAFNMSDRLSQHRTAAPTAKRLKTWPCKRSWEPTVMECLSAHSCKLIASECFECNDINELIRAGDALFEMLPQPNYRLELSTFALT